MATLEEGVWVAPGAQLYGDVRAASGVSIWPHVVARAEAHRVSIGRMSNIQDFVMLHVGYESPTVIGEFCSITHHATIHGATIGNDCLVGIGAVIMDGAVIGEGSIVAGGAVVSEGTVVPPGSIVGGIPGRVLKSRNSARDNRFNAWLYHRNAQAYKQGNHRAWSGPDFESWKQEKWAAVEHDADIDR